MPYFQNAMFNDRAERSIGTQPAQQTANQGAMQSDQSTGLLKYNQPQYANPYAPRTGPGGYPLGGYATGVGGFGQFDYQPISGNAAPKGLPAGLQGQNSFAAIARLALLGSAEAETNLRKQFGSVLAKRLGGIQGAQAEYERGLGYEGRSQGLSAGLADRLRLERRAMSVAGAGSAVADAEGQLYGDLAELSKGTATELGGIKRDELGLTFQAHLAYRARKDASRNALIGAAGELGGAALGNPGLFRSTGSGY